MNIAALNSAQIEYRRSKEIFERLSSAQELNDIKDLWIDFLIHFNRIFTKLEQACKLGSSKGWYDNVKSDRRKIPELVYLLHARNADEHGIAQIYEDAPPDVRIGAPGEAVDVNLEIRDGKVVIYEVRGSAPSVSVRKARVELVRVTDRGQSYEPPIEKSSAFKDKYTPAQLSAFGMNFIERVIDAAAAISKN